MVSSSFSSKIQALSTEEQQHIYKLSGGIPSLINALVKAFATKQQELTQNYELEWMLHEIWESLGKENQKILKEILLDKKVQIEDRLQKQFLTVTGITSENFEIIKPKLMESFTSKQINLEVLRKPDYIVIADKQIYLPDLTPQQEQILKLLIENEGKLVTRDDIAKKIWGEDHLEKYSDYAIDKQISKLRKYIKKSGINKQVISTKKGKGYVISAD
jgi:DNA-binding winged helix-turn-helix (wHTH) protein